jgi:hypothetical protein
MQFDAIGYGAGTREFLFERLRLQLGIDRSNPV